MNRYLLSAALLALLAAPAFAQQDEHHGGHPGGQSGRDRGPAAAAPAAAPAPAPAPAPAAPVAAPAQPQAMRGNAANNRHDFGNRPAAPFATPAPAPNPAPAQPQRDNRPDFNRGNRPDFNRGNDNRRDFGRGNDNRDNGRRPDFGRPDNRLGFAPDNRPGFGFGTRPVRPPNAPRPDFSHFRDFHRNFSAPHRYRAPSYRRPPGFYYRRWTFGDFLPSLFWGEQFWLTNYYDFDLPPPPPGTVWVRYGNDALLIDRYTGEIITVEYDVFY